MADTIDVSQVKNAIHKQFVRDSERTKRLVMQAADHANKQMNNEFKTYRDKRIQEIFKEAIDHFYDDYTPMYYTDRTGSLYDVMDLKYRDGHVVRMDYNVGRMSGYRSGYNGEDGLFTDVFMHGWHGGADHISADKAALFGQHPNEGVPYWRTPPPKFPRWGRPAAVAEISPYEEIEEKLTDADDTEFPDKANEIFNRHFSVELKKVGL